MLPQPDLKPVVSRSVNQMVAEGHCALQTCGSIFNRDIEWRIQSPEEDVRVWLHEKLSLHQQTS